MDVDRNLRRTLVRAFGILITVPIPYHMHLMHHRAKRTLFSIFLTASPETLVINIFEKWQLPGMRVGETNVAKTITR